MAAPTSPPPGGMQEPRNGKGDGMEGESAKRGKRWRLSINMGTTSN